MNIQRYDLEFRKAIFPLEGIFFSQTEKFVTWKPRGRDVQVK
jgi:hypothetical protein